MRQTSDMAMLVGENDHYFTSDPSEPPEMTFGSKPPLLAECYPSTVGTGSYYGEVTMVACSIQAVNNNENERISRCGTE